MHVMLKENVPNGRYGATLINDPLIFNNETKEITIPGGIRFKHPYKDDIKQLAKELNHVGDWKEKLVDVQDPFILLGPLKR